MRFVCRMSLNIFCVSSIILLVLLTASSKDAVFTNAMAFKLNPLAQIRRQGKQSEKPDTNSTDRRTWYLNTFFSLSQLLVLTNQPHSAGAVGQNSAAYDFQYYMRDLFQGNTAQGNVQLSKPPNPVPSRTLSGPLITLLLNNDCT
jgi:hypothetical protein